MPRREQIEELLKADPDDVFLHYALAMAYVSEGEPAAARERFQMVIDRDPHYVAAYFQMGRLLADEGETDDARHVLTHGIAVARQAGDDHAAAEMSGFLEMLS